LVIDPTKIIAASVVPVALISAASLLCLAFYNRLAAIVTRLRAFQREQLAEHDWLSRVSESTEKADRIRHAKVVEMLGRQTAAVLKRARLIRATLTCLLAGILCLIGCSFALGVAALFAEAHAMAKLAAPVAFTAGVTSFFIGILFAICEIRQALGPIEMESQFVRSLGQED
jgi:hypothetical protein